MKNSKTTLFTKNHPALTIFVLPLIFAAVIFALAFGLLNLLHFKPALSVSAVLSFAVYIAGFLFFVIYILNEGFEK